MPTCCLLHLCVKCKLCKPLICTYLGEYLWNCISLKTFEFKLSNCKSWFPQGLIWLKLTHLPCKNNTPATKNQNTTWLWSSQWGINYYDNQNKQKADYHPDNILVTLIIFLSEHTPLSTIQPMGRMFYFDQWQKSECHT